MSKKEKKKMIQKLGDSPINYWSDLFIVCMVLLWIVGIVIMISMAIYMSLLYQDTSLWTNVSELIAAPVTAGGTLWMIKNGVQHAIANRKGKICDYDFPKVNPMDDTLEREVDESEFLSHNNLDDELNDNNESYYYEGDR